MPLSLERVNVAAPDNPQRRLLHSLDLTLTDGTVTLLIGRTGSGKSTLLQTLAGLTAPTSGTVRLDGEPLWRKKRVARPHLLRLGLVFQFPEQQLFARSIRHEFAYSLRPYKLKADAIKRRIADARAEWDHRGSFEPDRSPFALSGGQRRRLALANTTATQPDWLLMDEPAAGLEAAAVRELLAFIERRRRNASPGGIVIATHDLDTFLPVADRVLVLQDGAIAADAAPDALCREPSALLAAGVGLPSCVSLAQAFAMRGLSIPADRLTPEAAADAIADALSRPAVPGSAEASADRLSQGLQAETARERDDAVGNDSPEGSSAGNAHASIAYRLDPRSKWLLYVLLVIGTMLQQHWSGLLVAFIPVLLAFIGLPRPVYSGLIKFARPLLLFFAISIALAGVTLTAGDGFPRLGFSQTLAMKTGLNLFRLFIVSLASLWFAVTTPYGRMVEGLNWALAYGKKAKLPVDSFALAVSLIFRFIPMILTEWQRFSAIVRARGKASMRPGTVRPRDIPALIVPLLLSLFHRAEDMTTAMEMKKIGQRPLSPGRSRLLGWTRADRLAVILGLLWLAALVAWRN